MFTLSPPSHSSHTMRAGLYLRYTLMSEFLCEAQKQSKTHSNIVCVLCHYLVREVLQKLMPYAPTVLTHQSLEHIA